MKRTELLKYLKAQGCELLREGGRHSWWHNPSQNSRSAIPRHSDQGHFGKQNLQGLGRKTHQIILSNWIGNTSVQVKEI
jgi:predicted RNA binding protein YcfA (HicA-like mRNA interferase family)